MPETDNADQIAYWNADAGETWAAMQEQLDAQLEPHGLKAMEALALAAGERIVDIGCGSGQTSLALGQAAGRSGAVMGLDISRPLLGLARRRAAESGAANVSFAEADVQTYAFAPATFNAVFSRFGVMFFADPPAAFANVRRALKPGGRLAFVCWRTPAENIFMTLPYTAVAAQFPPAKSFDVATFAFLLLVTNAAAATFQTGWFVESLLTELAIVLVIRTRQPAWRSRPSRLLMGLTATVALLAVAIPYLPGASLMGFVPLRLPVLAGLIGVTLAYVLASEWLKRWFFEHEQRHGPGSQRRSGRHVRRPGKATARPHTAVFQGRRTFASRYTGLSLRPHGTDSGSRQEPFLATVV
jgi:SAM-dependent methyltransferase